MSKAFITACTVIIFACAGTSHAQETVLRSADVPKPVSGQPVVLNSKTLFTLAEVPNYPAKGRAANSANRIRAVAENPRIDTSTITASSYKEPITIIGAGNELIMPVLEEDARAMGMSRQELALQWTRELRNSIDDYRRQHAPRWIMIGAAKSFAATLVFILALVLVGTAFRRIILKEWEWISRSNFSLRIQSFELVKGERIGAVLTAFLGAIRLAIMLVLTYVYLHLVLSFFPWTSAYSDEILSFTATPFKVIGEALWKHIPGLFFVIIIALLAYYLTRLLRIFFAEVEKGSIVWQNFYPEWAQPTFKICRGLIAVIALIMAFPYIPGSGSPAFKGVSLFLGVLISLGSTSTISNILAGYSLIYRRAFKVGDRVKIADFTGDVVEMRLEVTHLRTIKNEEIVVPNSMIISSHVTNYSTLAKSQGLILHTAVTIGYDTPWRQIHALLLLAASRTPGLRAEPAPFILQTALNDFYVAYELNVYCDTPKLMVELYSDLHMNIQDAFNEYGVQIMSPWYRFDPASPKIVPKEKWYAAPARPQASQDREDGGTEHVA
jgi:small-conductance mechanosensitive channel